MPKTENKQGKGGRREKEGGRREEEGGGRREAMKRREEEEERGWTRKETLLTSTPEILRNFLSELKTLEFQDLLASGLPTCFIGDSFDDPSLIASWVQQCKEEGGIRMKVVSAVEDRRVAAVQGTLFATHLFVKGQEDRWG
jgi:hypothetical protein